MDVQFIKQFQCIYSITLRMGHFFHIAYDIVELPQIKGGNSMKKLLAIILALACCLSLVACSSGEAIPETTEPSQAQQSSEPTSANTTQETNKPTQPAAPTQPYQRMCYWCDELPVGEFETYCINCRCLLCGELRKDGGGKYLYCRSHNCNATSCEYPAFEDSQYCSEHKCRKPNCNNQRWSNSEYCAHHK